MDSTQVQGRLDLETLRSEVDAGRIDTVLIAMTDMQGRLQGKRLTASHFLDEVVEHDAEGCNYLLAVDVDMNTVEGYAMSSWERGYGDFVFKPDMETLRIVPWQEGTALVTATWSGRTALRWSPRRGRSSSASSSALRARAGSLRRDRARVPRLHGLLRGSVAQGYRTSSPPTTTTSTTRCSGRRASSRS